MNSETKNNSILQKLATEVNDLSFQDLSEEVVNKAKGLIIDTIGCAFGAINSEVSKMVLEYVLSRGGKPQSTLIGTSLKTTPDTDFFKDNCFRFACGLGTCSTITER